MEVGDYVRTKYGIAKLIKIEEDEYFFDNIVGEYVSMFEHDYINQLFEEKLKEIIIKSSPRIIDLIDVGDYVNNCVVVNKKDDTIQIIPLLIPFDLKEKDIKSIVTREMFENMEYRIGDKNE